MNPEVSQSINKHKQWSERLTSQLPDLSVSKSIEWSQLAEELKEVLHKIDFSDLPPNLLWRGDNPKQILELLLGIKKNITLGNSDLNSDKLFYPNASDNWRNSIGHTGFKSKNPYSFIMSIGFSSHTETLQVREAFTQLDDLPELPAAARDTQIGHKVVSGDLSLDDIKYLIVRQSGDEPGRPKPAECYRVGRQIEMEKTAA